MMMSISTIYRCKNNGINQTGLSIKGRIRLIMSVVYSVVRLTASSMNRIHCFQCLVPVTIPRDKKVCSGRRVPVLTLEQRRVK